MIIIYWCECNIACWSVLGVESRAHHFIFTSA
nr:MAG TPA: hypothetical protein [Caudoviricetes sp.]